MTTQTLGRPRKYEIDAAYRICNTCQVSKPVSEFPPNYMHKGYMTVTGRCRVCKEWSRKHSTYGITAQGFQSMIDDQKNACAICKTEFTNPKATHIDHCHSTGAVRGLLCDACNHGLGKFKDSPELLRAAADYLD